MGASALTVGFLTRTQRLSVHVQMSGYEQVVCEQYVSVEFGAFQFLVTCYTNLEPSSLASPSR